MPFEDLFRAQVDRERGPVDLLTQSQPDISATRVVYRLGFRASFVDGFPDDVRIGRVSISYTVGPVLTQRTQIRQRPTTELIFDKHMERGVEVGRGHWVSVCQIDAQPPEDVASAMRRWREEAHSAIGLVAAILDERLALERLFEDVIYLDDRGPVTAGDLEAGLRHFLPYRITDGEAEALRALAEGDPGEQSPAARASRWYLRAAQQGPSADAVVALWVAIETLTPARTTSPKAIEAALIEAGWDVASQDLSVGRLAGLRADIVHHGVEDQQLIEMGYYHLEAITRVLLRRALEVASSWPPLPSVNWFVEPPADEIDANWSVPRTVWHDPALPEPDPNPSVGETQWHPPLIPPEDEEPPRVIISGETHELDARRVRYWAKQAARAMEADIDELRLVIDTEMPGEVAVNDERIKLSPSLLSQPNVLRELRLGWILQATVAEHLVMREGVPREGSIGTLLVELVGTWAQHREFIAGDGPIDEEDLSVQEPDSVSPDLLVVAGHLGAAIAGSNRAAAILDRWSRVTGDQDFVALVEGLRTGLSSITSPRELVARVASIYRDASE